MSYVRLPGFRAAEDSFSNNVKANVYDKLLMDVKCYVNIFVQEGMLVIRALQCRRLQTEITLTNSSKELGAFSLG